MYSFTTACPAAAVLCASSRRYLLTFPYRAPATRTGASARVSLPPRFPPSGRNAFTGRESGRTMPQNEFKSLLESSDVGSTDAAASKEGWPFEVSALLPAPPLLRPLLLISDLDDTLIGGAPCLNKDKDKEEAKNAAANKENPDGALDEEGARAVVRRSVCDGRSRALKAAVSHWRAMGSTARGPCFCLAINTGRTLPLFLAAVAERGEVVPEPDVLVCGVGTRIFIRAPAGGPMGSPSGWREEVRWSRRIAAEWSIKEVTDALQDAMRQMGPDCICWREPEENEDLKMTVCVALEALPALVGLFDRRMRAAKVCYRTVIGPTDDPPGWAYMDILPAGAGKNAAAHYVRHLLGCDPWDAVVSGDAPNDLDMLAGAQHHAIAVSNCHPSIRAFALEKLRDEHQRQQRRQGQREEQQPTWQVDDLAQVDGETAFSPVGPGCLNCEVGDELVGSGDMCDENGRAGEHTRAVGGCSGAAVGLERGPMVRDILDVLLRGVELRGPAGWGGRRLRQGQDVKLGAEEEEEEEAAGMGPAGAFGTRSEATVAGRADGLVPAAALLAAAAVGSGSVPPRPSLRVHLASLPAAGGVMEGLRAFGFI